MDSTVKAWIDRDPDPEARAELESLVARGDERELADRFATRLAFGTAGLRGVLGAGPNRMNRLVVRETSAGLGRYLLRTVPDARSRGVVVGHDARRGSRAFAEDAASVFAALGLRVYLSRAEQPTPVCAFATTHLGAAAGVVVTASHNPPEYNGYKVYWGNGAQIIPPHDVGIAAEIEAAARAPIPWLEPEAARASGLVSSWEDDVVDAYLAGVRALAVPVPPAAAERLVVAYTALHGVGAATAERAMKAAGFAAFHVEPSQRTPDGTFPTVRFPNPEEPGAMDRVRALAERVGADVACANDPDADRFAAMVRDDAGAWLSLTGDQLGALLASAALAKPTSRRPAVATTIVSSRLLGVMARKRGALYFETLTGFKWIANAALEHAAEADFVFGYEEALGYTLGTLVRDKDGISALVAFCELAALEKARGRSVLTRLAELYREHGLYLTGQRTVSLSASRSGPTVGERLRASPPTSIAGRAVVSSTDYATGEHRDAAGGRRDVALPRSDVLVYHLADDARVIVRPSGTEPKLKCYYEVLSELGIAESLGGGLGRAQAELARLADAHQRELRGE